MPPEFPFAEWVHVLSTSPETYPALLCVELGLIDEREFEEMDSPSIPHPRAGVAEVKITTRNFELSRVDFQFEEPMPSPAVFPASAATDPWLVDIEQVLDTKGRLTGLGLTRRARVLRPVSAQLAYELSFSSAYFSADAAHEVKDERILKLRRGRIKTAVLRLGHELKEAADLDLIIQSPGEDRIRWGDWAKLTHDAVHERLTSVGEQGLELGQLAGAVVHSLYAIEAGAAAAEQTFERAVAALTHALRTAGDSGLEWYADRIEAAIPEQEDPYWRISTRYGEGTPYGMLERVDGALMAIDVRQLDERPISGPPTPEEQTLEKQIIAEPRNIALRHAWGKLARLRNDPRGRQILMMTTPPCRGRGFARESWGSTLEALGAAHVQFRTGFAESAEIDIVNLIKNADALFNSAPLTSLTITGALGDGLEALLQIEQLRQLDHLCVSDLELDDEALIRLIERLPNVEVLSLSGTRLTERGRDALRARQPPIRGIRIDGDWLDR